MTFTEPWFIHEFTTQRALVSPPNGLEHCDTYTCMLCMLLLLGKLSLRLVSCHMIHVTVLSCVIGSSSMLS